MSISIPPGLKKAVETGNLVLFVGAGLSYNLKNSSGAKLGGWNDLVTAILDHLIELGHDDVAEPLKQLVGKYDPITILDLIESHKQSPLDDISDFVKSFFKLHEDNNYDLHRDLYGLSRIIVTTNYDCAFETAVDELRDNKAYKGKNHELARYRKDDAPMLFKLHGCVEDADSMVLFPSGYRELYDNDSIDAEHVLWVLGNIIYNKTILFLGTGLGDYQINNIFKRIGRLLGKHNQKHFIITTQNRLDSTLENFLSPITISSYDRVSQVIGQLLDIKRSAENEKNAQDQIYRRQLEELGEKTKSLEEQLKREQSESNMLKILLNREAINRFAMGVKHSLVEEYLEASGEYKAATEIKSNFHQAYNNWVML